MSSTQHKQTIVFINPTAKVSGGAEKSLLQVISYLRANYQDSYDVKCILTEIDGPMYAELNRLGVETAYYYADWWIDRSWEQTRDPAVKQTAITKQAQRICGHLQKWKASLVYTNTSVINVGAEAARLAGIPHVWHIRESIKDHAHYKLIWDWQHYHQVFNDPNNHLIFISKYLQSQLATENSDSVQIYNNVHLSHPVQARDAGNPAQVIDIILPFYADDSILQCLESLKKHDHSLLHKVYIIDDQGPDPNLREQVRQFVGEWDKAEYHVNTHNLGFVRTSNIGFELSTRDVILLNSDTIVTANWLPKLYAAAYQESTIATVTPLSNSASYFSVPDQFQKEFDNDPEEINALFEFAGNGQSFETHTGHGFCLYIKREVLKEIGGFDAKTFGKGYGEEVDFCLRAGKAGYKHVVAIDTYIHHWEGRSFGDSKARQVEKATKVINTKYPELKQLEVEFHARGDMQEVRQLFAVYHSSAQKLGEGLNIVIVGSIEENKGQERVMRAAAILSQEITQDINLHLVGAFDANDPYYLKLQELARNTTNFNTFFTGYLRRSLGIVKSSDISVSASKTEGLGRVVLEAMSCQTPVVVPDHTAYPELVSDGQTGLVYDYNSTESLAEQLLKLAADPGLRNRLSDSALEFLRKFEEENTYEPLVAEYLERVLGLEASTHPQGYHEDLREKLIGLANLYQIKPKLYRLSKTLRSKAQLRTRLKQLFR